MTTVFGVRTWDLEGLPKIPSWWVLGAFDGSGGAFSWTRKAKLLIEQLKALSYSMSNLVRIPINFGCLLLA